MKILELLESRRPGDYRPPRSEELEDVTRAELDEYLRLLGEAGFVETLYLSSVTHDSRGPWSDVSWEAARLTWNGHEFLVAVRNPVVRAEAERKAGPLKTLPFEVLKAVVIRATNDLIFQIH